MTDYFKRTRPGRPKKRGNQASDSIEVVRSSKNKKKRGPRGARRLISSTGKTWKVRNI
jgi:hypothetical protein